MRNSCPKRGRRRPQEGRRENRVPAAPTAPCAKGSKHTVVDHRFTGTRLSPRNGFNGLFRALPGDRLFATVVARKIPRHLTPAPRRQDHTTSPSASALFVKSALASTASHPASVTIAIRPSRGCDGME